MLVFEWTHAEENLVVNNKDNRVFLFLFNRAR